MNQSFSSLGSFNRKSSQKVRQKLADKEIIRTEYIFNHNYMNSELQESQQ
jgi:hypothetical protein